MRVCVRACVCVCVRVCVRACVCVCVGLRGIKRNSGPTERIGPRLQTLHRDSGASLFLPNLAI